MDKRDLTTFQEILLNYFEEEVLDRIKAAGQLVDETEVLEIVQAAYDEAIEIMEAIECRAISMGGLEPGEGDRYH
jgi:hypothetical protein